MVLFYVLWVGLDSVDSECAAGWGSLTAFMFYSTERTMVKELKKEREEQQQTVEKFEEFTTGAAAAVKDQVCDADTRKI